MLYKLIYVILRQLNNDTIGIIFQQLSKVHKTPEELLVDMILIIFGFGNISALINGQQTFVFKLGFFIVCFLLYKQWCCEIHSQIYVCGYTVLSHQVGVYKYVYYHLFGQCTHWKSVCLRLIIFKIMYLIHRSMELREKNYWN